MRRRVGLRSDEKMESGNEGWDIEGNGEDSWRENVYIQFGCG